MTTECIEILKNKYGQPTILTSEEDCAPYLTEWRGLWSGKTAAVLRPAQTHEAADMMRLLAAHNVQVVPQGGHTGLCGGAMPDHSGNQVILCADRLNHIRNIDPLNNTITVEAGVPLQRVQEAATEVDRLFPLSLAAEGTCQIGGNIATNAGGIHVVRYGNMRDLVLGLEVVLPNGDIWNDLTGLRKDNTGYDLKHLFIGSEGTLGFITAATLKTFPKPLSHTSIFCALDSPRVALETFHRLQGTLGTRLIAAELLPRMGVDFVLKHMPQTRDPFRHESPWYALFDLEHHGIIDDPTDLISQAIEEIEGLTDIIVTVNEQQRQNIWQLREFMSEAQKPEGGSIKHDISVPVSAVPEFLERANHAITDWMPDIRIVAFGHMGDGNIHYNLSQPKHMETQKFLDHWNDANQIVHDIVQDLNGSISAEHGIGSLKRDELAQRKPSIQMTLMHNMKASLDPSNLMNPDKVLQVT